MTGVDRQKQPFNPLLAGLAALAALFFVFPLIGMITGAPWGNVLNVITTKSSLDALGLSIVASLSSTALALLFGFPLAWLLARGRFRGKGLVRGLVTLPMVLPPTTGGSTIGSVVSPRTSPLPRKLLRARIQASGNPNSSAMTVLASEATMESPSASSELLLVMMPKTLPHGAPVIIPISGNTKKSAASAARQASSGLNGPFCSSIPVTPAAGTRSWPARPGPGGRARS